MGGRSSRYLASINVSMWPLIHRIPVLTNCQVSLQDPFPSLVVEASSTCVPSQSNRSSTKCLRLEDSTLANCVPFIQRNIFETLFCGTLVLVCHIGMIYGSPLNGGMTHASQGLEGLPYSTPLSRSRFVPSLLVSHQGATLPFGGIPLLNSVSRPKVWSRMSFCCSRVRETGF